MSNKILNTLSRTLPDDRPITALQVVESLDKCPAGFYPISKTYDQDQDADLWREGGFIRKKTRYLCLSKTEGLPNFVVKEIVVINEKSLPSEGFSLVSKTADSEQKAWRKKQLSYRLANKRFTTEAVTDIIICSRLKRAPQGFLFAGEINGVIICYKMGNAQDTEAAPPNPNGYTSPSMKPPDRPPKPNQAMYPSLNEGDHDYEILNPPGYVPARPAPQPPIPNQHSTHTLNANFNGLEGVPFIIHSRFISTQGGERMQLPTIKAKTMQQLLRDYDYPFTVEKQT